MEDEGTRFGSCKDVRKDLSESLTFQVDIGACIAHRRIQTWLPMGLSISQGYSRQSRSP
jgi:hypothetical protein